MNIGVMIIIAVVVGLLVGLIRTSALKASLKSVRKQENATVYAKGAGLTLTRKQDIYLFKNVEKVAKPKQQQPNQNK